VTKYKDDGDLENTADATGVCQAPRNAREQLEERKQICKGWVGPVPCIFGLLVVVDTAEDALWCADQRVHFPCREFEVHGREFEQLLEEAW